MDGNDVARRGATQLPDLGNGSLGSSGLMNPHRPVMQTGATFNLKRSTWVRDLDKSFEFSCAVDTLCAQSDSIEAKLCKVLRGRHVEVIGEWVEGAELRRPRSG